MFDVIIELDELQSGRGGFGRGRGDRGRGRGRGRGRPRDDDKEWVPITKLGRLVKENKIKSLEDIYLFSMAIKGELSSEQDACWSGFEVCLTRCCCVRWYKKVVGGVRTRNLLWVLFIFVCFQSPQSWAFCFAVVLSWCVVRRGFTITRRLGLFLVRVSVLYARVCSQQ